MSSPAEGERRAVGGYVGQYRAAATVIYEALRTGVLESIRIADPEAGRVDDLQLLTADRVDGYQVKWSRYPQPFSYSDLTRRSKRRPSLIAQLADGWRRLRALHPQRQVVVHLITNDVPSTRDRLPGGGRGDGSRHFGAFLVQCWLPRSRAREAATAPPVPQRWTQAWRALVYASGLSSSQFDDFVIHCRLDLGSTLGAADSDVAQSHEHLVHHRDVVDLTAALAQLVADPAQLIEIPGHRLIERLEWQDRLAFRSRHEFPEPPIPYREVADSRRELTEALGQHPGGYLILLGTPGSGKSTLLTKTLRARSERLVRYYAFVPHVANTRRGESINFLHDLVLALEREGFRPGYAIPQRDPDLLTNRLHAQLDLLNEDYRRTGRKTVILIDGLDHIDREQHPEHSLLAVLPSPDLVPEGVYIVLGSQTDELPALPSGVRTEILRPDRRLTMRALLRDAVLGIVGSTPLDPAPTPHEADRIYTLSGGHPLALAYILNRLQTSNKARVTVVLEATAQYQEPIDAQYPSHWQQVRGEHELVVLLALLARVRGTIDLTWVEEWADPKALYRLYSDFRHYFRAEGDGRLWQFFHNSFRVFLLLQTERLPGVSSALSDAPLYHELAEHCSRAPGESRWRWEELYYRARAGEDNRAIELALPGLLRSQFFAGRPVDAITDDLTMILGVGAKLRDPVLLARLVLTAAEFEQRQYAQRHVPLTQLLIELGDIDLAIARLRGPESLRVALLEGLQAAKTLTDAGLFEEGRRLFELAEPFEALSESVPERHRLEEVEGLLEAWTAVAVRFRPVDNVLHVIDQIKRGADDFRQRSAEEVTRGRRWRLRYNVVLELQGLDRWAEADRVAQQWDLEDQRAWSWWFWATANGWWAAHAAGEGALAVSLLDAALNQVDGRDLGSGERVVLAEGVGLLRRDWDLVRALIDPVQQPSLVVVSLNLCNC